VPSVAERLARFEEALAAECRACGRDRASVTLVAVSKGQPAEAVLEAYRAGQRDFGESRLQEALPKVAGLPDDIVWHMVGRLQSNKARLAARTFACLHSVCNERQLAAIAQGGATVDAFVQVNVAREPQKDGVFLEGLDSLWELVANCRTVRCRGLMAIAPEVADPELARWVFRRLAQEAARLGANALSMGMSEDWKVALQEGATHLRVGRALFDGP
jgi:pyridoxal phosphate enzyme (YggS family)